MEPKSTNILRGTQSSGANRAAGVGPEAPRRGGTLADAMALINEEVEALENAIKALYQRCHPFLEPGGNDGAGATEPANVTSPLAGAVNDLTARLAYIRRGIQDIEQRIAF